MSLHGSFHGSSVGRVQHGTISSVLCNVRLVHSAALEGVILDKVTRRMGLRIDIDIASSGDDCSLPESGLHQASIGGHVELGGLEMPLTIGVVYLFTPFSQSLGQLLLLQFSQDYTLLLDSIAVCEWEEVGPLNHLSFMVSILNQLFLHLQHLISFNKGILL